MGRVTQKRVSGHKQTAKTQISLRAAQSYRGLHCSLTESLGATECMNGQQRPG